MPGPPSSGPTVQLRPVNRPVLTLLLLSALTFFLGLGVQAITDSDEAFYAEASREMVEGGDWLTPHFNYDDRWQKPILYYWFTAGAFVLTGPTESAARVGAALSGAGLVLITWAAARRMTARPDAAWIAGAIAATCYGYFAMARSALPDLPLAFFITLAIWAALRGADPQASGPARWWAVAGLSAGLGFLTKGPVALVIPAIVLLPIWWHERRTVATPGLKRPGLRTSHIAVAVVLFALAGVPWYVAMTMKHGTAYLQSFFVADNLERFATSRFNGPREIWFYIPIVVGGLMPWTVFLLVLPWRSVRAVMQRRRRLTSVEWRLIIWTIAPLLLFTASVGKQPRYILPLLPPIAILLGVSIADRIAAARDAAARRELLIATISTSAMFAVLAVLLYRARGLVVSAYPSLTWTGIIAVICAAVALAWVAAARAWSRLPIVMAVSAAVLLLALQFGAFAGQRPEAVEEMAAMIRVNRAGGEPVAEYEAFVRNLVFYTGFPQVQIFDDAGAIAFLKSSDRVFLVLHRQDLDRVEPIAGIPLHTLGEVTYLNTASVRLRTLLDPLPAEDLETVVLVSNR